jgi:excisionase family DNA binding protein
LQQAAEARSWLTLRYGRRLVAEGRIPHYKVGGKVLVDLADVDALAARGRVPARASETV